jgi:Plastocyanin
MKTSKCSPLLFLLTFFFLLPFDTEAQDNQLKGVITLSPQKKKRRVSRGESYRNRIKGKRNRKENANSSSESPTNKLEEVIISLLPLTFEAEVKPLEDVVLIQQNKTFSPSILPITAGTTVYFVNEDSFYHNVFSVTPKARFNIGRRPSGSRHGKKIKKVGVVKVFCDIHPQMKATIVSLDTPYYTSVKTDGSYSIGQLPDGKYEVNIYHPDFKKQQSKIEVKNGQVLTQDFTVGGNGSAFIDPAPKNEEVIRFGATDSCCDQQRACKKGK